MWDAGPHLRGVQGRPLLRAVRHRAVEPRGRTRATRTSRNRRCTSASRVVDADFDLLVWTTTPWTLVSNVAAAVGRRRRATCGSRAATAARDLVACGGSGRGGLRRRRRGRRRRSPSPISSAGATSAPSTCSPIPDATRSVSSPTDFVTIDDGSGIVHLAPAFGEIDREVGEREGLPVLNPVDATARFDASRARCATAAS